MTLIFGFVQAQTVARVRPGGLAGVWRHASAHAACLTLGRARAAPSATRRCIASRS